MEDFTGHPYARKVLSSLEAYCARQERCLSDVNKRLNNSEVTEEEKQKILSYLIKEKFIDEQRYARAFVRDKIILNHWGKIKVSYHLKMKNIPSDIITKAYEEISEKEYNNILLEETKKLIRQKKISHAYKDKAKLARSLQSKGFEPDLIFPAIEKQLNG